jgi:lipoprotein NlpI
MPTAPAAIGAARFAALHGEFATSSADAGDLAAAADGYRHAHACRPHDPNILAALAGVLFDARDLRGARDAIEASLAIDPRSVSSNRIAANLDFVEERWADAIARFRYVASSDDNRRQAGYGQLMYWLAQLRGGIARPEFVTRTPAEQWPQPLLLYMRGEYTEAELLGPINAGDRDDNIIPNTSTDERLCEALFYVGEEHWARGQPDVARDYFAALVNIKVLYFLEHGWRSPKSPNYGNGDIPRFLANGDGPVRLRWRGRGLQSPGARRASALGRFLRGCSESSAFARCAAGALELSAFYRVSANAPVR